MGLRGASTGVFQPGCKACQRFCRIISTTRQSLPSGSKILDSTTGPVNDGSAVTASDDRSSKQRLKAKPGDKLKIESQPPEDRLCDWIGPPDQDSNLRPVQFFIPKDESPAERRLREMREDTQRWNQEYWSKHNRSFFEKKELYIQGKLTELRELQEDPPDRLTAEQLSVFYKKFLDENYNIHQAYNREWYRRNLTILWLSIGVATRNLFSRGQR